jgi:hypothetical protein
VNTRDDNTPSTKFENVQVIATPKTSDVSGKTEYETTFIPDSLKVKTLDVVVNYQLISPTPSGVKFKNVTSTHTESNQLSAPSISQSGKLVTFSDANTVKEKINLTFHFIDDDGIEFQVDPDLDNEPPPHL